MPKSSPHTSTLPSLAAVLALALCITHAAYFNVVFDGTSMATAAPSCENIRLRGSPSGTYYLAYNSTGGFSNTYCNMTTRPAQAVSGDGGTPSSVATSCAAIFTYFPSTRSSLRWINPASPTRVYCDSVSKNAYPAVCPPNSIGAPLCQCAAPYQGILIYSSNDYTGVCSPIASPGGTPPNTNYDCSYFRTLNPAITGQGVYTLPTGAKVYCDFDTLATSWTLLSTFEQFKNSSWTQSIIDQYFFNNGSMWINGNSQGRPLSPMPFRDNAFHVNSVNWNSILVTNKKYQLRQRFFQFNMVTGAQSNLFDVAYNFTYLGYTLQDQTSANAPTRVLPLTGRIVINDTTKIVWDLKAEQVQFWLPFSGNATEAQGPYYTACGGFDLSNVCGNFPTNNPTHRPGNAGIMGSSKDAADPAASWGPHMSSGGDILWVHQNVTMYGQSNSPMHLSYWIAPAASAQVTLFAVRSKTETIVPPAICQLSHFLFIRPVSNCFN